MKYQDLTLMATEFSRKRGEGGALTATFKLIVPTVLDEPIPCSFDSKALTKLRDAGTAREATWEDALALGRALADILLPDPVRSVVTDRLTQAQGRGEGLRLRLALSGEMQALPWEFMALNRAGGENTVQDFLALHPNVSIVRHPASKLPPWNNPTGLLTKVNLVAALCSPEDQRALDLDKERAALEAIFTPLQQRLNANFVPNATLAAMLASSEAVQVFHFAGHGVYETTGMGAQPGQVEGLGKLVFETDAASSDFVEGGVLGVALRQKGARVAVLGACFSASREGSSDQRWSGVAEALLKAEVGAVVGMQFAVKDTSAISFMGAFYKALLAGLTLDEAVCAGRVALSTAQQDVRGLGTPVLYLRDGDGLLLPELAALPEAAAAQSQVSQAAAASRSEANTIQIGSIDARYSQGMVVGNTGNLTQHFGNVVNTGGGDYVKGEKKVINTGGGAYFAEGSKAKVGGDLIGGNKNTTTINNFNVPAENAEATLSAEARPLVEMLNAYFDMNELEDVAFQLGIDWDNLRGEVKKTKARAIVLFCDKRGEINKLKGIMRLARPNLRSQLI